MMKFVDLSQDPPKEVEVMTLREIAGKISGNYGSYHMNSVLTNWKDDPEIDTPRPAFTINDVEYWKPEQCVEWQAVFEREMQREEDRKARRLEAVTLSKMSLVETLLDQATEVERRNSHCYTHNRGNSMQDGRKRVLELLGSIDFVNRVLGDDSMPKDRRAKLNTLVSQAKSHVKMQ